jgi:hypothetical protein
MSAELAVRKITDKFAKIVQNWQGANSGGTSFWDIIDGAGDAVFENLVKGQNATNLDAAIVAARFGDVSQIGKLLGDMQSYFSNPTTGENPGLGYSTDPWNTYFAAVGWRVPYEFAELYYAKNLSRLNTLRVFPKGTLVADEADPASAGMHKFGRLTGTAGAPTFASVDGALDTTKLVGSGVLITNVDDTPAPNTLVMRGTYAGGTTDITVALGGTAQHKQSILGQQAITGVSTAVISMAATGAFKAGQYVLLYENADGDTSLREIATILSVQTNTSITLSASPKATFTAAGFAIPLFSNVAFVSGTLGNTKKLDFWALPDRIIAL